MSLVLVSAIIRLGFVYQDLRRYSGKSDTAVVARTKNIMGLLYIAETEPMFRYYAQLQLMNYIDPNSKHFPNWAIEHARQNMRYRPYANGHKYAFAAYRAGDIDEAREMMNFMYRYYPSKMNAYASSIMNTDYYPQLRSDFSNTCHEYYTKIKQTPVCAEALPSLPTP